ncbi:MAG: dihydrolipoyl dehydrogenase [Proteobacteria bacterium]|nr:dihydrolipoyl dehydrogenase [Pseudomonadota bacterium]
MVVGEMSQRTDLLIIGGGPGGYAAAFRAADLGLDVTMVDIRAQPGGVCLFTGCIPSKALLFLSELIYDAARAKDMGLFFAQPKIDFAAIKSWKESITTRLAKGLTDLSKKRDIQWLKAQAVFEGPDTVRLFGSDVAHIRFKNAIIATGSSPFLPPPVQVKAGGNIIDSTMALELNELPESLLVIGGGYIGLELGQVYASLGSRVSLVVRSEMLRKVDRDLVLPLQRRMKEICARVYEQTTLSSLQEREDGVDVVLTSSTGVKTEERFAKVLVAVGRTPNTADLGLEKAGIERDEKGFLTVNEKQQTMVPNIYAVGDVTRGPMLAHRALRQGKVAAEVIAGLPSAFDNRAIPAVVYTDPQVAWCGLTEGEARQNHVEVKISRFPWSASGRAATMASPDGLTKLILEPDTGRLLGAGVVGRNAETLIAESVLAIEMGALAEDIALSIHPHPTLSETQGEAADIFLGSATHFINK